MKKRLNFETSLINYSETNSGFAKVKISIMTHEQVANGTHFKKDVIDKRKKNLNYLPVIGQFKKEDEDFGTHGEKIEITDDDFKIIKETVPYGVVMKDSARWENIKLKNGDTVEYLVADAYLWIEMYPELEVLYEGKLNNQSMEIKINKGKFNEDDWVYEVEDFEFMALCLLGKNISPAFVEAKVDVNFSQECFKANYQEMTSALDKYLSNYEQSEVENLTDETEKVEVEEVEIEDEFEETEEVETEETDTVEEITETDDTDEVEETEEVLVDEVEVEEIVEETEEITEEVVVEEVDETDYKLELENLQAEFDKINDELVKLREFKSNIEMEEKTGIVDTFKHRYSLEDSDIESVIANINTYSAKEVEDELCIIAFKKGASANYTEEKEKSKKTAILSNYENNESGTVGVKAILSRRK